MEPEVPVVSVWERKENKWFEVLVPKHAWRPHLVGGEKNVWLCTDESGPRTVASEECALI